jgi:hypothetical protein
MGIKNKGGGWDRSVRPSLPEQMSIFTAMKAVEEFVAEPAPALRRCGLCPAMLRSGNKSEPPRCSVCEKKFPGRRESE